MYINFGLNIAYQKDENNMNLPIYILIFIIIMNLFGFALCGLDKRRALKGMWRTKESTLLSIGLCGGGIGLLLGMCLFRHKIRKLKFKLLVPLECVLWGIVLIHTVSALTLDKQIEYVEISYTSAKITPELDGYLVAFVTDTHSITADKLRVVANEIDQFHPDLLLLGGDFPSADDAPKRSLEILSMIETEDGAYGVEGNHDNYQNLFVAMEQYGIVPLSNDGVRIRENLYLAGVEDLWNRSPDVLKAVSGARETDFVLLLSHNPDVAMQQDTTKSDLILSGHTHGGQITFFGIIAPALSWRDTITSYGHKFQSGWAKSLDGTDIFVSNGTGYLSQIPRIFARPQVILLTLRHEKELLGN